MAVIIYEQEARGRKAHALFILFPSKNATVHQLIGLDNKGWDAAAGLAQVNRASAATKELVSRSCAGTRWRSMTSPLVTWRLFDEHDIR